MQPQSLLPTARTWRRAALVLGAALLVPLVPFLIVGELPGDRWLSSRDASASLFAATGAALLAADLLLPVPSSLVGTMLGARLGFALGWLACAAGLIAGQLLGYGAGRLLGVRAGARLPSALGGLAVFASRPVPILAEAVAIAAGAARTPLRPFMTAMVAGNLLYAAALAASGAAMLPERWAGPGLALPMALPLAGWLGWWLWSRAPARAAVE